MISEIDQIIIDLVINDGYTYVDAVLLYMYDNDIDFNDIRGILGSVIISRLKAEAEAESRNDTSKIWDII